MFFHFFFRSWSDLTDIRLNRVREKFWLIYERKQIVRVSLLLASRLGKGSFICCLPAKLLTAINVECHIAFQFAAVEVIVDSVIDLTPSKYLPRKYTKEIVSLISCIFLFLFGLLFITQVHHWNFFNQLSVVSFHLRDQMLSEISFEKSG